MDLLPRSQNAICLCTIVWCSLGWRYRSLMLCPDEACSTPPTGSRRTQIDHPPLGNGRTVTSLLLGSSREWILLLIAGRATSLLMVITSASSLVFAKSSRPPQTRVWWRTIGVGGQSKHPMLLYGAVRRNEYDVVRPSKSLKKTIFMLIGQGRLTTLTQAAEKSKEFIGFM